MPPTPSQPRRTRPWRISVLATRSADDAAMANEMPCAEAITAVFTPITRPCESTSGPPELPGLSAASVCSTLSRRRPVDARIVRPSALTMPAVTLCWKP